MNTNGFVWLLSHDEVNQDLAPGRSATYGLNVLPQPLKEPLPDGDCQAFDVDLDSAAPDGQAL
jgi:hypothetical protein